MNVPRKKEELERLDINLLAMFCLKVAESHDASLLEVEQARQLRHEWKLLIGYARPPLPELKTQQDIDAYAERLQRRMVDFLSGTSSRSATA